MTISGQVKALQREALIIERSATRLNIHQRAKLGRIRRDIRILTQAPLVFVPDFVQPICRYPECGLDATLQRIRIHYARK